MRREEARALGALGGNALAQFGGLAKGVHIATSQRIFSTLGPIGTPVRLMHDGISAAAYGSVETGLRAVPRVAGRAVGRAVPPGAERMADSPVGGMALA